MPRSRRRPRAPPPPTPAVRRRARASRSWRCTSGRSIPASPASSAPPPRSSRPAATPSPVRAAVATTDYLTRLDKLEQEQAKSNDYQNAPAEFERQQRELELDAAGGISD